MTIPLSPSCTSFIISMKRDCIACKDHHATPSALQKTREMHSWEGCAAAMRAWFKCSKQFHNYKALANCKSMQICPPENACCERRKQDTPWGDTGSMRNLWYVSSRSGIWMNLDELAHIPESLTALSLQCSLHSFWPQQNQLIPFVSFYILSWFCKRHRSYAKHPRATAFVV